MKYKEAQHRAFLQEVEDWRYFVTDLELRESKSVHTIRTIQSTSVVYDDIYPEETDISYEIIVEYVKADKPKEYLSYCIDFELGADFDSVVMATYNKLLARVKYERQ